MIYVEVRIGIDKALQVFKKKVENLGLMEEIKKREFFIKPSLAKRQRRMANARRKKSTTD